MRRVKAVLRRTSQPENVPKCPIYTNGDLVINTAQRRVFIRGKEAKLTATEYQILYHLACNAWKVLSHDDLLTRVWVAEYRNDLHYIRNYIISIRKIEDIY